jgi:hypothetical protein
MSKHHHHPDEGHSGGNAPRPVRDHLHHNRFFYVSGVFLFIALLIFVLSGNLRWQINGPAPQQAQLIGGAK